MGNPAGDDWHLREWADYLGKRQADLVRDLGWLKARASKVWNSSIPYRRELVNEIAAWLGIRPYELLMRPEDAMALRRFRESARSVAAAEPDPPPFDHELPARRSA